MTMTLLKNWNFHLINSNSWKLRRSNLTVIRSLTFYYDSSIYIFIKYISSFRIDNKEIRIIVTSNEKSRLRRGESVRKAYR